MKERCESNDFSTPCFNVRTLSNIVPETPKFEIFIITPVTLRRVNSVTPVSLQRILTIFENYTSYTSVWIFNCQNQVCYASTREPYHDCDTLTLKPCHTCDALVQSFFNIEIHGCWAATREHWQISRHIFKNSSSNLWRFITRKFLFLVHTNLIFSFNSKICFCVYGLAGWYRRQIKQSAIEEATATRRRIFLLLFKCYRWNLL